MKEEPWNRRHTYDRDEEDESPGETLLPFTGTSWFPSQVWRVHPRVADYYPDPGPSDARRPPTTPPPLTDRSWGLLPL